MMGRRIGRQITADIPMGGGGGVAVGIAGARAVSKKKKKKAKKKVAKKKKQLTAAEKRIGKKMKEEMDRRGFVPGGPKGRKQLDTSVNVELGKKVYRAAKKKPVAKKKK